MAMRLWRPTGSLSMLIANRAEPELRCETRQGRAGVTNGDRSVFQTARGKTRRQKFLPRWHGRPLVLKKHTEAYQHTAGSSVV